MNELIKVTLTEFAAGQTPTVNARELHGFLEVKTRYTQWLQERIEEYDFIENQDYVSFSENSEKPQGGRPSKEYAITLDMAKELAMVERNDKGKAARKYFIECEHKLKGQPQAKPAKQDTEAAILRAKAAYNKSLADLDKSRVMQAEALMKLSGNLSPEAVEMLTITAAELITQKPIPYRPQIERKTYTATEIGERLGISANMVGKLANRHGLKTPEYGIRVLDKSKYSDKQVEGFRYYEGVLPILEDALRETI